MPRGKLRLFKYLAFRTFPPKSPNLAKSRTPESQLLGNLEAAEELAFYLLGGRDGGGDIIEIGV